MDLGLKDKVAVIGASSKGLGRAIAFGLAEEIGISLVVPVHWDMFAANSVSPDEIMAIYRQIKPRFDLEMNPAAITL